MKCTCDNNAFDDSLEHRNAFDNTSVNAIEASNACFISRVSAHMYGVSRNTAKVSVPHRQMSVPKVRRGRNVASVICSTRPALTR